MPRTKLAIFYQETGEDAVVELSDSFTLEDAKEYYPEWTFRHVENNYMTVEDVMADFYNNKDF